MRIERTIVGTSLAVGLLLTACAASQVATNPTSGGSPTPSGASPSTSSTEAPVPSEKPVPTEDSPPGDIPDNIAFVPYRSKAGSFSITTPEGWSRTTSKDSVTFTDKLNTVQVSWAQAPSAPTVRSATADEVPVLQQTVRAFTPVSVKTATLPAGPAVLISYQANSEPNRVTGKQYRQDGLRYELFHQGTQIDITLLSPVGADNVDPWRIVTESFAWA
ncbi:MAG: hypothetical protein H0W82_03725 [Actinobacteria bacterium]|nr:hypothetical protein [Actinomycetota bacterium]